MTATYYMVTSAFVKVVVREAETEAAGMLLPGTLRSLDAIHLASAMALRDELAGLLTHDSRLAAAAEDVGISVVAPR